MASGGRAVHIAHDSHGRVGTDLVHSGHPGTRDSVGTDLVHSGPPGARDSVGTDLVHSRLLDSSMDLLIDRDCSWID